MESSIFVDGIGDIAVAGGVVRIDWVVHRKKSSGSAVERQPVISMAIPIEGFANSMIPLQQLIEKMVKDGVVKARGGDVSKGPGSGGSPNFQ